ncbi:transglutaminase domain-containing protein [bacterium]|nr:transglutaminase domain-containing protein [bacterium]MCI0603688.1 transglutaminase domain-containing protein [bacterium]
MRIFLVSTILVILVLSVVLDSRDKEDPAHRTIQATYTANVEPIPQNTESLRVWVPVPSETSYQSIKALQIKSPYPAHLRHDPEFGNTYLYLEVPEPRLDTLTIQAKFQVDRRKVTNKILDSADGWDEAPAPLSQFLRAERLVTLSPRIRALAAKITEGMNTVEAKTKAIYDYVLRNVTYDKSVPGWGNGDTERVCIVGKGNCTDFHSLFISLARASGIPARFIIGFPVPEPVQGTVAGYHCWAEFYLAGHGWVPVDPSDASKSNDSARRNYLFGNLDPDRIQFTVGRDIRLDPLQSGEPLNYFIYPYAEADGKPITSTRMQLDYVNLPQLPKYN